MTRSDARREELAPEGSRERRPGGRANEESVAAPAMFARSRQREAILLRRNRRMFRTTTHVPLALGLLAFVGNSGCARAPSPLAPGLEGSIGMPHRGVLTRGVELTRDAEGVRWLRGNDRHWAAPRFVAALERAAAAVARERPGPPLLFGDLSVRQGGQLPEHMSHRTGHDVDLLLFVSTLSGAPVASPGFVRFDADGLAWDEAHQRFLRFDVARTWLLVRSLVLDDEARIEWIFLSRPLQGLLTEWALARGENAETVLRAVRVMLQPGPPAETHDDHLHVRTGCDVAEMARGCEPTGPERPWINAANSDQIARAAATSSVLAEDDEAIALELLQPLESDPAQAGLTR
jgi:penicillin-insensitive murein endopeptidase